MTRRSARAGTTVNLRARIVDDLGDSAQASGVQIYLLDPDILADEDGAFDLTGAFEDGIPTYWEDGIFEYSFSIPNDGPDGFWHDIWFGELNGQLLSGVFVFEVSASGIVSALEGQFNQNNIVEVTISSGVYGLDGSSMDDDYSFRFLTEITPAYTSVAKVTLEAGGAFPSISQDIVELAILEASIEADQITFNKDYLNNPFYQHARREWATCRAAAVLATNARTGNMVRRKQLGDFQVEYDAAGVEDLLDRVSACLKKWEPQVNAGGLATRVPSMVIKGETDPDRILTGRVWRSTEEGNLSRRIPASNTRTQDSTSRRWQKDYKGRW